jgi:hypothetical protein
MWEEYVMWSKKDVGTLKRAYGTWRKKSGVEEWGM